MKCGVNNRNGARVCLWCAEDDEDIMALVTSDERVKRRYDYVSMSVGEQTELDEMGAFDGWNKGIKTWIGPRWRF